jgi:hypothetical protein
MVWQRLVIFLVLAHVGACSRKSEHSKQETLANPSMETQDPIKLRNRLNKLLYWQIADELKLSAVEEKRLVQILDLHQQNKESLLKSEEDLLKELDALNAPVEDKKAKELLDNLEGQQEKLAKLDRQQFQDLRTLLGSSRYIAFHKVRRALHEKLMKTVKEESQQFK